MKVFVDMDGVLTDFNKRYVEKFGEFPKDVDSRTKHFWNNWKKFVDDRDFETLEKHEHADELLHVLRQLKVPIEILSSSGGGYSHDIVTEQKIVWLKAHGIEFPVNIVPGGGHKAKFADPWHILIDDTPRVIERYRAAGGTAILHTNIEDTVKQLLDLNLEYHGGE